MLRRLRPTEQLRVARVGRVAADAERTERIEIRDLRGEPLLSFSASQLFNLLNQLTEVGLDIANEPETVESMLSTPAVTAADLAAVFEMGRQAGARLTAEMDAD